MKNMKKISIILSVILILTGVVSCEQLDLTPKDKMSEFDYFKNATELELFTNPFYNDLLDKTPSYYDINALVTARALRTYKDMELECYIQKGQLLPVKITRERAEELMEYPKGALIEVIENDDCKRCCCRSLSGDNEGARHQNQRTCQPQRRHALQRV